MRLITLPWALQGAVIGSLALAGCNHCHCQKSSCCRSESGAPVITSVPASPKAPQGDYLPAKGEVTAQEPPLSEGVVVRAELSQKKPHDKSSSGPAFGHAEDYSWVTGELWYVPGKNVWRVHYGSGKDNDRYGGTMTLSDTGPMSEYRIGQLVYVEGRPVDASSKASNGIYRVTKILELADPDAKDSESGAIERASARHESP
jgi:hypothetical protein